MATWVEAGQKFDFFVQKSWFFCNSKHFNQNIMTPCYSYYCCIFYVFHSFQIIMVSLFLARHDQCLKIRTFSNFSIFHSKQSIMILQFILLIAITYSRWENKKKKCWDNSLIKSTVYLLIFHQNLIIFKGLLNNWRSFISPNN